MPTMRVGEKEVVLDIVSVTIFVDDIVVIRFVLIVARPCRCHCDHEVLIILQPLLQHYLELVAV